MTKALITNKEAITYLGLDRQGLARPDEALRWLCRSGQLRYSRVGRRLCFRQEWLDAMIDRNTTVRGQAGPAPR